MHFTVLIQLSVLPRQSGGYLPVALLISGGFALGLLTVAFALMSRFYQLKEALTVVAPKFRWLAPVFRHMSKYKEDKEESWAWWAAVMAAR